MRQKLGFIERLKRTIKFHQSMQTIDDGIQEEIQARVEFKMNEFKDALNNTVKWKYRQAFDMTRESNEFLGAWREFEELFNKEVRMLTPSNDMVGERKRGPKDVAVEKIMKNLDQKFIGSKNYDHNSIVKIIVREIERAQNY